MLSPSVPTLAQVAPPRGERGLKLADVQEAYGGDIVAPPRGERGLKHFIDKAYRARLTSLPLVGSVD